MVFGTLGLKSKFIRMTPLFQERHKLDSSLELLEKGTEIIFRKLDR